MSEHGYSQFLPGDVVSLELEIKDPRMHLREAGVVFRHAGRDEIELSASGPVQDERTRGGVASPNKVAKLEIPVPGGPVPGLYRVDHLLVKTYGGRIYRYDGEEITQIVTRIAFEVLEEPDEKPGLGLSFR